MSMLIVLGALGGLGISFVFSFVVNRQTALELELARLDSQPRGARQAPIVSIRQRLGRRLLQLVPSDLQGGSGQTASDLELVGRSAGQHAASIGTLAFAGAAVGPGLGAAAALSGFTVPLAFPVVACLALGVAGAVVPVIALRARARVQRRHFRQALGCWLDLVSLGQAGGMGIESALQAACSAGSDPTFARLRRAIDFARHSGDTPWQGLQRLGEQLRVVDLEELASSLSLAGTEGARVRASLAAKAASLRTRELAEAEAEANSTTEKLFVPAVVMMLGFLLFIGYPALVTVSKVL